MKIKKMVGAVALTAALAMGSVPAFATTSVGDMGAAFDDAGDGGKTEIKAEIDSTNPQVKAQVPLSMVVVFSSTGGNTIQAPSSDAYGITNVGTDSIKLVSAEIDEWTAAGWNDCVIKYDDTDGWVDKSLDELTGSNVMFTLEVGDNFSWLTQDHGTAAWLKADKSTTIGKDGDKAPTGAWVAPTIASGDTLGIEIGGYTYFEKPVDNDDLTDSSVCKIKYTIASAAE